MQLKMREFRPRIGPAEYRVVQPWEPLRHTALGNPDGYGCLIGDHEGLARLAALFSFAAYSPRTIVHVPLRKGAPLGEYENFIESCGGRVDLVLVHHSLGLRVTKWPELRRRLVNGRPITVRTDEARTNRDHATWLERRDDDENRDWLRPDVHASTLFLTGSRDVLASASTQFEFAAGRGLREEKVPKGHSVLVSMLSWELRPDPSVHRMQFDICFKARPPYEHFRRPGRRLPAA
ncbi:hypothetical protein ACIGXA_16455 [Streptomyces fildesensis]|uniref:Uncharacterized protein n=1 Tax=Streptomyces fildesensis TaxID=375757 RepID=A0ABW8C6Q5_9ACTN